MKTMDELGSVLMLAALVLGTCAAADSLLLVAAAGSAGPGRAAADGNPPKFISVVQGDRVVFADHAPARPPAAPSPDFDRRTQPALAAGTQLSRQSRLSW